MVGGGEGTMLGRAYEAAVSEPNRGGDASQFAVAVRRVLLVDGSTIDLPSPGITAVVGANNAGKSTLLREMSAALARNPGDSPPPANLVSGLELERRGTGADLLAWLDLHAHFLYQNGQPTFVRTSSRDVRSPEWLANLWFGSELSDRLGPLHPYFVFLADAMQRLVFAESVEQRGDIGLPPEHPLHYLQDDAELLDEIVLLSETIFRRPLTLDRLSGRVSLRVGRTGLLAPSVEAVTAEYRQALARLPQLAQQGDGMKSLLGLVLPLATATYPVVLVDEPEAFLHPPQAAALGAVLGKLALDRELQIVLATHDRNLLGGLLDASVDVSVVRLERGENFSQAHQLDSGALKDVWTDPTLRYTNLLDGLFHRSVVLAEADGDCRYYAAALDSANDDEPTPIPPSEILFVPAGGKAGLAKAVRALSAVRVPVVVTPDLDVLNDEGLLRGLVEALGGDWAEYAGDYRVATAQFRGARAPATVRHVRDAVNSALAEHLDAPYTSQHRDAVLANLRAGNPWSELKRYGVNAFTGQAAAAAARLLDRLDALGLVAVRAGELERLAPTLGVGKGSAWLPAALAAGEHRNDVTQVHVRRLLAAMAARGAAAST